MSCLGTVPVPKQPLAVVEVASNWPRRYPGRGKDGAIGTCGGNGTPAVMTAALLNKLMAAPSGLTVFPRKDDVPEPLC